MWQITGTRVCRPSAHRRPDGWATWAPPDLCVYCYLLGHGKLFITATAKQEVPAGPASARTTSILGGKKGGCPGDRAESGWETEEGWGSRARSSPEPGLAPAVALYPGDDAWILSAPSGILEELCDHGLVAQPS